jgi:transposase
MARVFIGVDPHRLSATIEVVDEREAVLATGRFSTDKAGYAAMRRHVTAWPDRIWAVEGSNGTGRPLAQRLLADGERVVDVPAKLSARARLFDTGHNRKTDAHDAHAVAVVAVRTNGLRVLSYDDALEALRMLVDAATSSPGSGYRPSTGCNGCSPSWSRVRRKRTSQPCKPRRFWRACARGAWRGRPGAGSLLSCSPSWSRSPARCSSSVTPTGWTGQLVAALIEDLFAVGPVVAARILADVGDVARFSDRNRFASWTGTAPLDASSGEQIRHRLSRAGNRKMNHMLHLAAATQIRLDTDGRAYYRRKLAEGKTRMEAMRCLKRRISDAVYRQLLADARREALVDLGPSSGADPGGHCGASRESSAVDLPPHIDTSDQPLPGPAQPTLQPAM